MLIAAPYLFLNCVIMASMGVHYRVPFYANTADNNHCFQAAIRMILKYFWRNKNYAWRELDRTTGHKRGSWTWPMAGLMWLKRLGLEVRNIEAFDYERFATHGLRYLVGIWGKEVATAQDRHSNLQQERKRAIAFLETVGIEKRSPTVKDLQRLLMQGYILICGVNAYALAGKPGYSGHGVVIKGFDSRHVYLHDPGLPAMRNRKVDLATFERAWAYPNAAAKNIAAFKKSTQIAPSTAQDLRSASR